MSENYVNENLYELFDEDGNKKVFEHLDTVLYGGGEYAVFIPYDDEETEVNEVLVFKLTEDKDGEKVLEQVVSDETLSEVYDIFREKHSDEFDFDE